MDPNPTADGSPVTPGPSAADAAPADPGAPQSLGGWFRQNAVQLVIVVAVIVAVCSFLHPLDVLLAGLGLSLIIFIHELGHFAAAKWCDVHVKTFSIGFGPALPFCQFKYGETTYKLAMVPLGGYVAMVGEEEEHGDTVDPEDETQAEADADPRSFKNKPVGQRMLIISAGVVMNVLLGAVCFAAAYLHGVEEAPAVVSAVEPGSAAWRAGIRPGTEVVRINSREHPWFDDLKPAVMSTRKGEHVTLEVEYRGARETLSVEPMRQEGALFPQIGIAPPLRLVLRSFRREDIPPYTVGSPAAAAAAPDGGPGFKPGDRIVAMSDPADPAKVTPIDPNWDGLPGGYFDYANRLARLAGKPVTFHVVRKDDGSGAAVPVTVGPAYHKDTGLRMRIGEVVAVRRGSPAEKAGIQVQQKDGDRVVVPGDEIVSVEVPGPDGVTKFTTDAGPADPHAKPLDPLRLPWELNRWADRRPTDGKVKVTVLRLRDGEHTRQPVALEMEWDPAYRDEGTALANAGSPTAVGGLGLAYHVQTVVAAVAPNSPAAAAGLQPGDQVTEARFRAKDHTGKEVTGKWEAVRQHQWTYVDYVLQSQYPHSFDARVKRGDQTVEVSLTAADDPDWPVPDRGLVLSPERRTQKAEGIGEALRMGADRTLRSIKTVYLSLYAVVFGRISPTVLSGPIGLARVSYILAGEDVWHLLILMGLISINLAVVNFLPIPVLDGGHMTFLLYELVRGKPAPVGVQVALTYVGLAIVLGLMLFVIGMDIWRLFF